MRKLRMETQHLHDLTPEAIKGLELWNRSGTREHRLILFVVATVFLCILTAALVGGLRMADGHNMQAVNARQK